MKDSIKGYSLAALSVLMVMSLIFTMGRSENDRTSLYEDQIQYVKKQRDSLDSEIESLQTERDSLYLVSARWKEEKDSMLMTLRKRDGVWIEKAKTYAIKKDSIIHNSTNSELADFLSRH